MATKAPLGSLYAEGPEEQGLVDEIKGSYAKLREALDSRQNQLFDPVLLAMAQGFLSPTKTGSFGESLGNVAAMVGPAQQAQEKRAQEIASMKMELAQRELAQRQSARGEAMFREMLPRIAGQPQAPGASAEPGAPTDSTAPGAPAALQGRPVTPADVAILASVPGMGERAKILGDLIKSNRERYHVSNDMIVDKDAPGGPKVIADLRVSKQEPTEIVVGGKPLVLNMNQTEQRDFGAAFAQGKGDEYYEKFLKGRRTDVNLPSAGGALVDIEVPLLGEEFKFRGTPRQAAMIERLSEEALKLNNPTALRDYVNSIRQPMAMPAAPAAARPSAPAQAQPPMPAVDGRSQAPQRPAPQATVQPTAQPAAQPTSDLSSLPLKDQEKIMIDRITLADKPAQETAGVLQTTATPSSLNASDRRMRELDKLVADNPQVVGLMNKQGLMAAIGTAANEGFRAGPYTVSLPVKEFVEKLTLNPKEQAIARRIAMILDEEFFNRAALAKSALGPQISNADSILMKSPMARPEDAPQLIRYWALHGQMVNRQNDELYRAYNAWLDRTKGKAPARQFFDKEGRVIINKYTPFFEQLQDRFNAR